MEEENHNTPRAEGRERRSCEPQTQGRLAVPCLIGCLIYKAPVSRKPGTNMILIMPSPALTRSGQASEPLRPCARPKQAITG